MILDDAEDQLQLMQLVFGMVDAELKIVAVQSGEVALEILRTHPDRLPKVVLLDLRMPGMHGLEVLKEIKADPALRRIPVCAFSNGDVAADVCECYENGASFYFKKPVGLPELKKFAERFSSVWFEYAAHC
jgi:CheY-like chemotaxis protein